MKKLTVLIATLALCLLYVAPAHAVLVAVDGNLINFDVPPYIDENNRTMVPIRFIAEEMGAEVDYNFDNPMKKEVYINKGDISIVATIDSDKVVVNGQIKTAPTAAKIVNGRTMVPLRFCEYLGVSVAWMPESATAHIFTTEKTEKEKQAIMVDTAMKKSDGEYEVSKVTYIGVRGDVFESTVYSKANFPINIPDIPSTPWIDESTTLLSIELVNMYGMDFLRLHQTGKTDVNIFINAIEASAEKTSTNSLHDINDKFDKNPNGTYYSDYPVWNQEEVNKIKNANSLYFEFGNDIYKINNPLKK